MPHREYLDINLAIRRGLTEFHHDYECDPARHQGRWRTLYMYRGGNIGFGKDYYHTAEACAATIPAAIVKMKAMGDRDCDLHTFRQHGIYIPLNTVISAFPIPAE